MLESASKKGPRAPMIVDAKLPEGYVVLCTRKHEEHVFLVKNLAPSFECPRCGNTALSVDLLTDFFHRHRDATTAKQWGL